jgi:hypothetical protein
MAGTDYFADKNSTVKVALTDALDNAVLAKCTVANMPSGVAGYAVSCVAMATDSGALYLNTGSVSSATFTLMDTAATSLQLPEASTDASTATGVSLALTQNLVTTGKGLTQSLSIMNTGLGHEITATAATLTTGRYYSANDGALEVFGIGANGHIHTLQTTAPVMTTNSTGLSATAIVSGSTDVAGSFTTTGTPESGTVLTLTFHKTYTTAPKAVVISPANAAGGGINTMPIVTTTATTIVFTWPGSGVYAATPSISYQVIA